MPSVTVRSSPSGLPMANTLSPTVSASELPSSDGFEFRRVLVFNFQQRDVLEFIDGDDLDLLVALRSSWPSC